MIPCDINPLRQEMKRGKKVSAAWLHGASNITAEIMGKAGMDVVVIDMEHGPGDILTLISQIQGMQGYPTVPFVRSAWNDFVQIKRILDAGAYGLFIPYVNTKEEAEAVVNAVSYPSQSMKTGIRGMATSHRAAHFAMDPKRGYLHHANDQISVFLQIETPKGLSNLDEILTVERVDGIVIGPMDLATNMGFFADPSAREVQEAIAVIEKKTLAAGKMLATIASDWDDAAAKYRRGYSLVLTLSDTVTLGKVTKNYVDLFTGEFGGKNKQ